MTRDEIMRTLVSVLGRVAPDVDAAKLDPTADLREQADLDSVDLLNVVIGLHETLGVDIPEADYPELTSLDRAVAYLFPRLADPGGSTPA